MVRCPRGLLRAVRQVEGFSSFAATGDGFRTSHGQDSEAARLMTVRPAHGAQGGGDLDGLPTIARIRSLFASLGVQPPTIVVLSGEGDPQAIEAFMRAGATEVLRKPASQETLKALAAAQLARKRTARRGLLREAGELRGSSAASEEPGGCAVFQATTDATGTPDDGRTTTAATVPGSSSGATSSDENHVVLVLKG